MKFHKVWHQLEKRFMVSSGKIR